MKPFITATLAALCGAASLAPAFAADVGVSVSVSQPGLYGRIDINQPPPPPALVYAQPVVVVQQPVRVVQQPVYLHVPPGHEKHWSKHCREYNACGVPVYFVRDNYYREHYDHRGHGHDDDHGHGKGHGKGHDHD